MTRTDTMIPGDIASVIRQIYDNRLTTSSGGNISVTGQNGDVWITPAASDKGALEPDDIVCIHSNGELTGRNRPSTEYPFHRAIYEVRPDIKAIIHAHPPALVAFSLTHQIPDVNVIYSARAICGKVGYAVYAAPGSVALGESLAREFQKGFMAVIMENHGVAVGGTDLADAFHRFEMLELCAEALIHGKLPGPANRLPESLFIENTGNTAVCPEQNPGSRDPIIIPHEHASADHISSPDSGEFNRNMEACEEETEMRHEMVRFINRALRQGLMQGQAGAISVRAGDGFLINRPGLNLRNLKPDEIVKVPQHNVVYEEGAHRIICQHQAIYQKNHHVNSIITAMPPYLMGWAIAQLRPEIRTIPETVMFLGEIALLPFNEKGGDWTKMAEILHTTNAVIHANDAVIITGSSLMQAFDRLEIAEFNARSFALASSFGTFHPLTEEQIRETDHKT